MNRENIIQSLLNNMEAVSRAMVSRKTGKFMPDMPTHAQLGVMLVIMHEGPQSMKSLANKFQMTSSAATQLVNGLVKTNLLTRIENKTDRRKMTVEMTAKGHKVLMELKKQREKYMLQIFEPLTDNELIQLSRIQKKITQRLQTLWIKKQI